METDLTTPRPPLSRWLADRTRTAHRRAEAALLPDPATFDFLTVRTIVLAHHRVLHRYAAVLDSAVPIAGVPPASRWLLDAAADLRAWRIGTDTGPVAAPHELPGELPPPTLGPATRTAELVGARYVLEGARLGLRALAGSAREATDAAGVTPSRLFAVEPDAGGRWHAVRGWLDDIEDARTVGWGDDGPVDRSAVLAGARAAFATYERC